MVGAEMQSFWADFIHVAACRFPGAAAEMQRARPGLLWVPSVCIGVCAYL